MASVDKLLRLKMAVGDMPKAKAFYTDLLGLKIESDYRVDDRNWWVSLATEGGASVVLTTAHENMKPGTMSLYFASRNVDEAHRALHEKAAPVGTLQDDLYGPGSGVKWFNVKDPDGNQVFLVQA